MPVTVDVALSCFRDTDKPVSVGTCCVGKGTLCLSGMWKIRAVVSMQYYGHWFMEIV
jgi:hypothetical protein